MHVNALCKGEHQKAYRLNNDNNAHLTAIFQDNLGELVPECHHSGCYWNTKEVEFLPVSTSLTRLFKKVTIKSSRNFTEWLYIIQGPTGEILSDHDLRSPEVKRSKSFSANNSVQNRRTQLLQKLKSSSFNSNTFRYNYSRRSESFKDQWKSKVGGVWSQKRLSWQRFALAECLLLSFIYYVNQTA